MLKSKVYHDRYVCRHASVYQHRRECRSLPIFPTTATTTHTRYFSLDPLTQIRERRATVFYQTALNTSSIVLDTADALASTVRYFDDSLSLELLLLTPAGVVFRYEVSSGESDSWLSSGGATPRATSRIERLRTAVFAPPQQLPPIKYLRSYRAIMEANALAFEQVIVFVLFVVGSLKLSGWDLYWLVRRVETWKNRWRRVWNPIGFYEWVPKRLPGPAGPATPEGGTRWEGFGFSRGSETTGSGSRAGTAPGREGPFATVRGTPARSARVVPLAQQGTESPAGYREERTYVIRINMLCGSVMWDCGTRGDRQAMYGSGEGGQPCG